MSALPINVIYYNDTAVGVTSDHHLPLCTEGVGNTCEVNGSEAYAMTIGYYTTKDIHPLEVHKMGWQNINRIYPQVRAHLVIHVIESK